MQKYVVILNAPPDSGKDYGADLVLDLVEVDGWHKQMFKTALYEITAAIHRVPLDIFIEWATDRELKESPFDELGGLTPRESLIETSESVIKPYYGDDYFGRAAAVDVEAIPNHPNGVYVLFSDGGFVEEAIPVFDLVGWDNAMVIRLYREGRTFEGDSRRYLEPEDFDNRVKFVDIQNNSTLEDLAKNILFEIQYYFHGDEGDL